MATRAVVLAAGQGKRMKSALPKVLHEVAGRSLLDWVLEAVAAVQPDEVVVVVGHEAGAVRDRLPAGVRSVVQADQLGTGHATRIAMQAMGLGRNDEILVLPGDAPLITGATLARLLESHRAEDAAATLLTSVLADPTGYGRVVRDAGGHVRGIVEQGDAGAAELAIDEVGTSMYVFQAGPLQSALSRLDDDNAQGEEYLTDVIGILAGGGDHLAAVSGPAAETAGVNSMEQLAAAAADMRRRINASWMAEGVWMADPDRTYVDADVVLSTGVRLYPGVHLEGATSVAAGAEIGPDVHMRDTRVGEEAVIRYAVIEGAEIGARADVGPYARLRAGTVLGPEAKAGTYVELKQTVVGARTKVPHLSYLGDAEIGEDSNIGAASITCNYDGYQKHRTVVGDRVRIGSDTMLVAPVEIGDDAWTGAGSVISHDVPPGALGVARSQQKNIPDYAARRRRRAEQSGDT